jgi:16S rRNA (adenine1518-N6/adenine1519-N6)-dimethyltransferase
MTLDNLPPLRESLAAGGITAHRRFGQHFLLDLNVCRKIARLAGPLGGELVLEIGPGPGGLTRALLEAGARVIAIEKDERFAPLLGELEAAAGGALTVALGDALALDERVLDVLVWQNASVVANLPYNVGAALLLEWLIGPFRPRAMTLMFQKELAARIVAPPGGRDYGRLSIIVQALCEAKIVLDLPARAFTPPPKVASSVVQLRARTPRLDDQLTEALQVVGRHAFGQRRKMLRSSLRPLGGESLCVSAGIDPTVRAQDVPVQGYLSLARAWLDHAA